MSWLGSIFHGRGDLDRLDAAIASNLAAQEGLEQAGKEAGESAVQARRQAVFARWQARKAARRIRDKRLRTGDVRDLVDEMLSSYEPKH